MDCYEFQCEIHGAKNSYGNLEEEQSFTNYITICNNITILSLLEISTLTLLPLFIIFHVELPVATPLALSNT